MIPEPNFHNTYAESQVAKALADEAEKIKDAAKPEKVGEIDVDRWQIPVSEVKQFFQDLDNVQYTH